MDDGDIGSLVAAKLAVSLARRSRNPQPLDRHRGHIFCGAGVGRLATRLVFFLKHSQKGRRFTSLLPHLLLCGVLLGTSVVLEGPGVFSQLSELKLDFLGRFLFYVALVWSVVAVLDSLSPVSATLPERK